MDDYFALARDEQRGFCELAAAQIKLDAPSIEKDFWVCWILRETFALPNTGSHLTFKGGTSLSKGWKLIERFSEDIDVVIARDFLGFGGDKAPEGADSKKQREARLEELREACRAYGSRGHARNPDRARSASNAARYWRRSYISPTSIPWRRGSSALESWVTIAGAVSRGFPGATAQEIGNPN
jgi:hypothetical protein